MRLALDLGTTTGYALVLANGSRLSGRRSFKPRRHENWSARFTAFRRLLSELAAIEDVVSVHYEEVHRHKGTDAAHVYGGFVASLGEWCEQHGVALTGVGVGTIKKFATGNGAAGKAAMIEAAFARWGVSAIDDNEADAVCLRELVVSQLGVTDPHN